MMVERYLDVGEFSQRVDADTELMIELYQLFLEDSKKSIAHIVDCVERNDAEALKVSAHTLKGSSASISARAMQGITSELEIMAIANDLSNASSAIMELKHCHEMTIAEIQSVIGKISRELSVPRNEIKA